MKRTPKFVFFVVALFIVALAYTSIFGVYTNYGDRVDTIFRGADNIRTGIDISGGIEATFVPKDEAIKPTANQVDAMKEVIVNRMIGQGITDYEAYSDTENGQVIVRFPWKKDETEFDAEKAINELGGTALLKFYIDSAEKDNSLPTTVPEKENLVFDGNSIDSAEVRLDENGKPLIVLNLKESGKKAFADATLKQKGSGTISIWLDDGETVECISNPKVNDHITDGVATISADNMEYAYAVSLANKINFGSLPFSIKAININTITATMGARSLEIMIIAGIIAFILISIFMLVYYRLTGFVAVIALLGQVAGSLAVVSGFFPFFNSFTLTLPGIAGIILSIGMGVDANVITSERIKEQIRAGKTIDTAINNGCKESFAAIFDGNITVVIVSVVLMGVFGPSDNIFAKLLSPILLFFPVSTSGAVYSFGFTLLAGIIFNFIMGVTFSRLMLKSLSRFKFLRKPWLLGGKRA